MNTNTLLFLIWTHWFADFILQSDKIALNKSNSNITLLQHVALYGVCFIWAGWQFALANAVLHFATDWVTSRATKKLYQAGHRHWFFVVIGLDQALHMTAILLTADYFGI